MTAFTGGMPKAYDELVVPFHFAAHAAILARKLAGLTSGEILETAAGTGALTQELGAILPDAVRITATDAHQSMLDQAATRRGLERVRWQQVDATALPFADATFDALTAQFGVMFFPDKHAAYTEAWRVLKPGGRFVFNVWDRLDRNAFADILYGMIDDLFPTLPVPKLPIPFSYYDPAVIEPDLRGSGFVDICFEPIVGTSGAASARDVALALCRGQNEGLRIDALGPGNLDRAMRMVEERVEVRFGHGRIEAPNQALLVSMRRPAG